MLLGYYLFWAGVLFVALAWMTALEFRVRLWGGGACGSAGDGDRRLRGG